MGRPGVFLERRQPLAAFALGAATVAGFAPFGIFVLPFLTLAWLLRAWREAAPARAARLGYAWGLGFFLAGVSWVYVSLNVFGDMPMPLAALATLLFCALLAAFPAVAGYAFARWRSGAAGRDALLAAGLWELTEWLRGWILTGFPWLALGYSQSPPSPLAGFAPVLGVYGIGLLVALTAAALASAASKRRTALLVVALAATGFALRGIAWTQPAGAPLKVALLQGNIPQGIKWDPQRATLSLETYAALAQRYPADLTVLPETAIPLFFDEAPRDLLADLTVHGPALIGVAVRMKDDGRPSGYTNAAVALSRRGAAAFDVQAYAKRHLVPFGEYAPPGFSWFFRLASIPMSDFTAGPPRQAPLAVAGQKIAPNICYEDLFGEELIRALPAATLLVNLSNTAWFGDSLAQPQHLQISRMRAMETGRPMLRATNTGMTAAIAPDGRVAAVLEPFSTGALVVEVQGYAGATPFVRYGNTAAVTLALAACLPALRRRRRAPQTDSLIL
ncbi:MAG: apolipoprotein N-acyltransferase [Rhodocyclaceae bacterium]|nr:apolipoprotein N-acyltransferase [Rhodocyclaceae bacterium]